MKKASIFLFIIILILGLGYILFGKNPFSQKTTDSTLPLEKTINISPLVTQNATTTYAIVNLSYPKSSKTELPEIFDFVQKINNDFVSQYGSLTKAEADKMQIRADEQYELYISTKTYTSNKTVSYVLEVYEYTGGAHGGTSVSSFTYDLSGKLVNQSDVLLPGSLTKISDMARQYFYNSEGEYANKSMIDDGVKPIQDNYSAWYLTDKYLVFIFGQYQVGPYVLGIQEYKITKTDIQDLLQPSYK